MTDNAKWYDGYGPEPDPVLHIIRHADTGVFLCVFKNSEDVDAWLDDFDADEQDNFDVVMIPQGPVNTTLLLEKDGSLMPIAEHKLARALFLLRDDKTIDCKLHYFDGSDISEKEMKTIHKPEHITPSWVEWWKLNDFPWRNDWEASDVRVPGEWPPEPEYDEEGNLVGEEIPDESGLWKEWEPQTDDELKELAMAMRSGTVFSSDHMRGGEGRLLGSVFMPLMLGGANIRRQIELQDITLFYEYLDQAGPRGINGMPCFFSVRMLNSADHKRLYDKIRAIEKALAAV